MRIAIIEDLDSEAVRLSQKVRRFLAEQSLEGEIIIYTDGESFLSDAPEECDVVLLDIYLGDNKINGIETARRLRSDWGRKVEMIFVSVSKEHAVEGFALYAVHYVLKPYGYSDIKEAMSRALKRIRKSSFYIRVKCGWEEKKIRIQDILYVDYFSHAVQLHLKDEMLRSYMQFSQIEQMLKPYRNFIWCYRNVLVNLDEVLRLEEGTFVLKGEIKLPINKKQNKVIRQKYIDYHFSYWDE